jgi:hypothetical protein
MSGKWNFHELAVAMTAIGGASAIGNGHISEKWGWLFVVLAVVFAAERIARIITRD